MFKLMDPPVYELPIEIDFNEWLASKGHKTVDTIRIRITIVRTEWMGEGDPDGKRPYEVATMTVYEYGTSQFITTTAFAEFLQRSHPIAMVGVRGDVNNWYHLLNFAAHDAIDFRAAEAKTR